jgi:hypothetical protein
MGHLTYGELGEIFIRPARRDLNRVTNSPFLGQYYNEVVKQKLIVFLEEQLEIVQNSKPNPEIDPSELSCCSISDNPE